MNPSEEQKGTGGPPAEGPSPAGSASSGVPDALKPNLTPFQTASHEPPVQPADPLDSYQDGYPHDPLPDPPPRPSPPRPRAGRSSPSAPPGWRRQDSTSAPTPTQRRRW